MSPSLPPLPPRTLETLDRYLGPACSPEESTAWQAFLAAAPEAREELDALFRALGPAGEEPTVHDITTSFARLLAKRPDLVHAQTQHGARATEASAEQASAEVACPDDRLIASRLPSFGRSTQNVSHAPWFRRAWRYGAAAMACALLGVVALRYGPHVSRDRRDVTLATQVYQTGVGERATVQLPDGSVAQLAPETRIEFARAFGRDNRTVMLRGEAVFTVVPSREQPFAVAAGATEIRVLGTTFGVRAYPDDADVRVAVAEGKVSVHTNATNARRAMPFHSIVLTLGDVSHTTHDGATRVERGDVTTLLAWTQGRLTYQRVPLARLARDLERWYGFSVRITDPVLAQRMVTTELQQGQVDDVLRTLAQALDARYVRVGTQATFSPR